MQTQRGTGHAQSANATLGRQPVEPDASSLDDLSQLATVAPQAAAGSSDDVLLLAMSSHMDAWLSEFEEAWHSDTPPALAEFFARAVDAGKIDSTHQRQALLHELIAVDLEHRWKRQVATVREFATLASDKADAQAGGGTPRLEDYRELLEAQFGPLTAWPMKLILSEFRVRHCFGDRPEVDEYKEQFPDVPGLRQRLLHLEAELTRAPAASGDGVVQTTLQGDYELRREIARGGMGIVYEAWQRSLRRTVAVKTILAGQFASPEAVHRFQAEAQAAAKLNHPHIVPVYEVGRDGGQHFFSMGYVDGESLSARVTRQGPLPPTEAAALLEHIAEAVQYAHRQGVVHRDLKPQNVLLTKDGRPMVTDFGLAKHINEAGLTLAGQVVGTPAFMSPEQAQGRLEEVGPVSDVYSLGAILYYLLTGRPPFHTASMPETLRQVIDLEPAPPRSLNPEVSRDLETICLKCLEKEAAKRYASAQDLADDLRRYGTGDEIQARPISHMERAWRWCRRRPASAALAVTIFLVLAVGVPVLVWSRVEVAASQAERRSADALRQLALEQTASSRRAAEAAHQLAATQQYFATVNEARQIINRARPGWTRRALAKLSNAAGMNTPGRNLTELRTEAASCLMGTDLSDPRELVKGMQPARVTFSPDGRWLAVGEFKHQLYLFCEVRVIDAETGSRVHDLSFGGWPMVHRGAVVQDGCRQLAFSPDRRWLAAATRSGHVHAWDLNVSPPAHHSWRAHDTEIFTLVFSPDGKYVYTSDHEDKTVKAWSVEEKWRLAAQHVFDDEVGAVTVDPRGGGLIINSGDHPAAWASFDLQSVRRLSLRSPEATIGSPWKDVFLIGGQRGLELYDAAHARVACVYADSESFGRDLSSLAHAEFSGDGRLLLVVTREDRKISLWDAVSGKLLFNSTFEPDVPIAAVLSPDGRRLAMTASRRALLFDLDARLNQPLLADQPYAPVAAAWTADLPTGSQTVHPTLGFLRAVEGTIAAAYDAYALATHVGTKRLALTESRAVTHVWDFSGPQPAELIRLGVPDVSDVCFSADGGRLYGISKGLDVWSWTAGQPGHKPLFDNRLADVLTGRSTLLSIVAGRSLILLGGRQGELLYAADETSTPQRWQLGTGPIGSIALSPDEALAACGTEDGEVRLVTLPSGKVAATLARHEDGVASLDFSSKGGLLASASLDRSVRIWRKQSGRWTELLTLRFPAAVLSARFHPDGETLALQVQEELAVRLLSLESLRAALAENSLGW